MTLDTFYYTDNVDDVMAAHVNQFFGTSLRAQLTNTQSISATLELTDNSLPIQNITPTGANQIIELPPLAGDNHICFIRNASATFNLTVMDAAGAITYAVLTPLTGGTFVPHLNGWVASTHWDNVSNKPAAFTPAAHTHVWANITNPPAMREVLANNRTYFVRTDGNNANTGLVDSSAGAFLTIQHAINVAAAFIDRTSFDVTIQVGNGTYNIGTSPIILREGLGQNRIFITGNVTTPANVIIQSGAHGATNGSFFASGISTQYEIKGFRFTGTGSNAAIHANYGAVIYHASNEYGTGFLYHIESIFGGMTEAVGNYAIIGGTTSAHLSARGAFARLQSRTVTLTGTPNFPTGFVEARYSATIFITGNTFSGAATGPRFLVDFNAVVQSSGATLPGSVVGTTATGGHYA